MRRGGEKGHGEKGVHALGEVLISSWGGGENVLEEGKGTLIYYLLAT